MFCILAAAETNRTSPRSNKKQCKPLDNSTMIIKVAGQEYRVTNTKRKSRSLGSLTDLTVDNGTDNNNKDDETKSKSATNDDIKKCVVSSINVEAGSVPKTDDKSYGLSKSKSECNPFEHRRKGKIIRLTERPKAQGNLFVGCMNLHEENVSGLLHEAARICFINISLARPYVRVTTCFFIVV